jgi:hypothetical protein
LTAFLPEPNWDTPGTATSVHGLFWETKALTRYSLLTLGQFIAEREREIRETLREIELGVGINVSGFGVEVSSKGLLPLLKPYQWINMWRNVPREMYVRHDPSNPGGEGETGGKPDMEKLHELENEVMSSSTLGVVPSTACRQPRSLALNRRFRARQMVLLPRSEGESSCSARRAVRPTWETR